MMQKLDMKLGVSDSFRLSEAYKVVRTNLTFLGNDIKAIVFTSSIQNEGKSTVSWNVANSLAQSGKKVVYIDADMRKSVFMAKHRVKTNPNGLSQFLSDQSELIEVIYATPQENLFIIPAGPVPPNPSELLSRQLFADAIAALKEKFDYIIIDAPPLAATTDPAVIAAVCDGSVMVIGAKRTSAKLIKEGVDQLTRTGKPVLGSILNMVDYKYYSYGYEKYYSKYGYGYNYGYGYGYGKSRKQPVIQDKALPVEEQPDNTDKKED